MQAAITDGLALDSSGHAAGYKHQLIPSGCTRISHTQPHMSFQPNTVQWLTAQIQGIECHLKKKNTGFFSEAEEGNEETATSEGKEEKKI